MAWNDADREALISAFADTLVLLRAESGARARHERVSVRRG